MGYAHNSIVLSLSLPPVSPSLTSIYRRKVQNFELLINKLLFTFIDFQCDDASQNVK